MSCKPCDEALFSESCQICSHSVVEPIETPLYKEHVKPLMYFCAIILLLVNISLNLFFFSSKVYSLFTNRMMSCFVVIFNWIMVFITHARSISLSNTTRTTRTTTIHISTLGSRKYYSTTTSTLTKFPKSTTASC